VLRDCPADAAFELHRNERYRAVLITINDSDKCVRCGALYHRAPLLTPFYTIACVVCGSALPRSDTFPSQSVVAGPTLATVPGCGTFDSSVRCPGTEFKEN
jgi:hypothetical protein